MLLGPLHERLQSKMATLVQMLSLRVCTSNLERGDLEHGEKRQMIGTWSAGWSTQAARGADVGDTAARRAAEAVRRVRSARSLDSCGGASSAA